MKSILFLLAAFSLVAGAGAREFTSSDGKRSFEAEFIRYDKKRDRVTLRLADSRNLVTEAKHFSDEDRHYFNQQAKATALDAAIKVDADDNGKRTSRNSGKMRFRIENVSYTFEISNTSDYDLDDLEVKHWVVVAYAKDDKEKIYEGTSSISQLAAGKDVEIEGPKFTLTLGAVSTCDCPRVAEAASRVGRDRVIGERVEVRTGSGKLLFAESSSRRVDQALGIDKKKD